jgi:hypothetical protein
LSYLSNEYLCTRFGVIF